MFVIKKRIYLIIILAIIFIGIFVRSYHFSDWMHFELDQARDANVISDAIKGGIGQLPLLGPRASGTYLRLGPAYYYFSYLSAKVLGNNPPSIAAGVLFFSILSLPLFFLFCRRYFNRKISTILLLVFSLSLYLVMYARFAWNPNPLVFFILLFFYALLKMVDKEEERRGLWAILTAIAFSISTQLHFLAFVAIPIILLVFIIIKKPKIRLKYWALSFFVVLFLYAPVLMNEINTEGANTKEFIEAVSGKTDKNQNSLMKNIYLNFSAHADSYTLIISSKDVSGLWSMLIKKNPNTYCTGDCPDFSLGPVGVTFLILGVIFLVWNIKKEKNEKRRDFLILSGLIFFVTFAIFTPLAASLSPRFFLVSFAVPIVFLGFILEYLDRDSKKYQILLFVLVVFLVFSNLAEIIKRFGELGSASQKMVFISEDKILKERTRVTYSQEKMIKDYMEHSFGENNFPVYYSSDPRYLTAFEYFLERDNIDYGRLPYGEQYKNGNYFYITFSDEANRLDIGKYSKKYDITGNKDFGTLTVLSLMPKEEYITRTQQDFTEIRKERRSSSPKRYKWDEIFNDSDEGGAKLKED